MGRLRRTSAARRIAKLAIDDVDRRHFLACEVARGQCGQCCWAANKQAWKRRLQKTGGEQWLEEGFGQDGSRVIGCRICRAYGGAAGSTKFGQMQIPADSLLHFHTLEQHSKTKLHRQALAKWRGADHLDVCLEGVPPAQSFQQVLDSTRKGQCTSNIAKVGRSKKLRKMKWCLAEARRALNRRRLRAACAVGLHQDARKGWLAVRFSACGRDLEAHVGVLGCARLANDYSLDALGVRRATMDIIKAACTPLSDPPYCAKPPAPVLDEALETHLRSVTELLDADAASDEHKACKLLRGKHPIAFNKANVGASYTFDKYLPNIEVQNKDKAHASK